MAIQDDSRIEHLAFGLQHRLCLRQAELAGLRRGRRVSRRAALAEGILSDKAEALAKFSSEDIAVLLAPLPT